jgi:hypothetical protein
MQNQTCFSLERVFQFLKNGKGSFKDEKNSSFITRHLINCRFIG